MKAVIMAGGKGTRIASVAGDIPKPMIKIEGKPVLEYEIECLREQGFTDIIITVNHLSNIITDYFGDGSGISPTTGSPFDIRIKYFFEKEPLGNAGALFKLKDKLTEDFLLLNADVMFDIDFNRFIAYHERKGGLVTLFTHPNTHPFDSGLIIADANGVVTQWLTKEDIRPRWYHNRVNAGIHIMSPRILQSKILTPKVDLDRQLLKPLAGSGKMFAYSSPEYVKDIGTPERYETVCQNVSEGKVAAKNLRHRQKAVFLDRDGTINSHVGFLHDIEQFKLLPDVSEAIRKINESGYLAILVTNQPVIARGEATLDELEAIHAKLETMLGLEGAYLDAIYCCPHHPDKGFVGERAEYKVVCNCRKPKPGMLLKAAQNFNIDLSQSWMVGDSQIDIEAGLNAGCKAVLITQKHRSGNTNLTATSLLDFVKRYI